MDILIVIIYNPNMVKKIDILKEALRKGDNKKALRIAKDFWFGINKEQKATISRAYECLIRPDFYQAIGYDPGKCIDEGLTCLRSVYKI